MRNARDRYQTCVQEARARSIPWELTFEQWYNWWSEQGYDRDYPLENSASGPCMCRIGDQGPYRLDNIYCATRLQNSRDRQTNKPTKTQPVKTPWGVFKSLREAANTIPITQTTQGGRQNYIRYHCNKNTPGWKFL